MFGKELLRFLISYWYIALVILFFLLPTLYRIQDTISGRSKREAKERLLSQKEEYLSKQAKELDQKRRSISSTYEKIVQDRQHLNDLVRSRTVDMARNVASRKYLQSTPAFSVLSKSDRSSFDSSYYEKLRSVLTTSMQIISPFDISADILSDSGKTYHTTLHTCSCPDYQFRKSPCKHMLRLALESGLLLNTDTTSIEEEMSILLSKQSALMEEEERIQHEFDILKQKQESFEHLLSETKQTYPWLSKQFSDLYEKYDEEVINLLRKRTHSADKTADRIERELKQERSKWKLEAKQAEYQLHFYESLFPWLLTFKEVPPIEAFEYSSADLSVPQDDQYLLRKYLSPEEYAKLPSSERYQLALNRYISQKKSPWAVGIEYERYIGYLCESSGYSVNYTGATDKLEDMGRDLILEKGSQTILVQCKRWAKEKTIHENHVFQLAGSTYEYQLQHQDRQVIGAFVATIDFSPVASHCAEQLGLPLFPNVPFQEYPRIKCNIRKNKNGEIQKIYHLPMDQQYDKVKINSPGEFYAWTVKEAEDAGFRRAYRWHGSKQE